MANNIFFEDLSSQTHLEEQSLHGSALTMLSNLFAALIVGLRYLMIWMLILLCGVFCGRKRIITARSMCLWTILVMSHEGLRQRKKKADSQCLKCHRHKNIFVMNEYITEQNRVEKINQSFIYYICHITSYT